MDWSHLLTAVVTAVVSLMAAWTTLRVRMAKIARMEQDNRRDEWAVIRGEWEELLAEERLARKKLMERSDEIDRHREELRDKLALALTEILELKTRLQNVR